MQIKVHLSLLAKATTLFTGTRSLLTISKQIKNNVSLGADKKQKHSQLQKYFCDTVSCRYYTVLQSVIILLEAWW